MSIIWAFISVIIALFGLYPASGYVVEIEPECDTVIVETANGHLWGFYGIEDWEIGDGCSMLMSDNGTENITDDVILSVRYNGFHR